MTGPMDALRSLRAARSVPDRLERVEETVRDLATAKDAHEALLGHLTGALDQRIEALEVRLIALEDDLVRRRALSATTPFDPRRLAIVHLDGDTAIPDAVDYVALLRRGDRLAAGWPEVAIEALDDHPEMVAAYGERIDVIVPTVPGATATLISRFEPVFDLDALDQSPCIDLSSVIVRRTHVVDPSPPSDGWELLRRLASIGPLLPVQVTASVGPIAGPTT